MEVSLLSISEFLLREDGKMYTELCKIYLKRNIEKCYFWDYNIERILKSIESELWIC